MRQLQKQEFNTARKINTQSIPRYQKRNNAWLFTPPWNVRSQCKRHYFKNVQVTLWEKQVSCQDGPKIEAILSNLLNMTRPRIDENLYTKHFKSIHTNKLYQLSDSAEAFTICLDTLFENCNIVRVPRLLNNFPSSKFVFCLFEVVVALL